MYHLEQLRKQGAEVEKFKATQPEFTTDPLPSDLLFDGYDRFLSPIPVFGYPDKHFAIELIVPHFEQAVMIINGCLQVIDKNLGPLGQKEKKLKETNLQPSRTTKNALNVNDWRMRVYLTVKENRVKLKRVQLLQEGFRNALTVMTKLRELALELCEHPRMYTFNLSSITSLVKNVEHDVVYRQNIKLIALKQQLIENTLIMKNQIKLFGDKESAVQNLTMILREMCHRIDPLTRFIPESEEHLLFSVFTKSVISPLREITRKRKDGTKMPLPDMITAAVKALIEFTELQDPELIFVLTSMVMRQFITTSQNCEKYMRKMNEDFVVFLESAKQTAISALKPPRYMSDIVDTGATVKAWCETDVTMKNSLKLLAPCKFYNDPTEIAYQFNLIHLSLAGKVANKMKLALDHTKVIEGVEFLWRVLIIAQEDPNIDGIIDFVEEWSRFKLSPKEPYRMCVHPIKALKYIRKMVK